jgi:hypothetical protein
LTPSQGYPDGGNLGPWAPSSRFLRPPKIEYFPAKTRKREANLEHLPPGGWADVARKDDIDRISIEIDRRSSEIDRRFSDMDRRLSRMTAAFLSIGLAIFAIQVEILLNL